MMKDGWKDGWTDGHTNIPCILQDIAPLESMPCSVLAIYKTHEIYKQVRSKKDASKVRDLNRIAERFVRFVRLVRFVRFAGLVDLSYMSDLSNLSISAI